MADRRHALSSRCWSPASAPGFWNRTAVFVVEQAASSPTQSPSAAMLSKRVLPVIPSGPYPCDGGSIARVTHSLSRSCGAFCEGQIGVVEHWLALKRPALPFPRPETVVTERFRPLGGLGEEVR